MRAALSVICLIAVSYFMNTELMDMGMTLMPRMVLSFGLGFCWAFIFPLREPTK